MTLKPEFKVELGLIQPGVGIAQLQEGLLPVPLHTGLSPSRRLMGLMRPGFSLMTAEPLAQP